MLRRFLNSSWFIPTSVLVIGGVWFTTLQGTDREIQDIESAVQVSRSGMIHERPGQQTTAEGFVLAGNQQLDRGQAPRMHVSRENMYPRGNPPYRNILKVAAVKKKAVKKKPVVADSSLQSELEAA